MGNNEDALKLIAIANKETRFNQLGQVGIASFCPRPVQGKHNHVIIQS